jgi:ribose-phosphate pyrophosphokinase
MNRWLLEKNCFAVTHPVMLTKALENIKNDNRIEKDVITITIPVPDEYRSDKIKVLSIAPLLAEVIKRIHECVSISSLLVML